MIFFFSALVCCLKICCSSFIAGERPYKCNICSNRFSTKGNLKVHFQRHKSKYPHVKMNENMVPEHLDNPSPGSSVLVAPIPGNTPSSFIPPPIPRDTPKKEVPLPSNTKDTEKHASLLTPPSVKSEAVSEKEDQLSRAVKAETLSTPTASETPTRTSPSVGDTATTPTNGSTPADAKEPGTPHAAMGHSAHLLAPPAMTFNSQLMAAIPGFPPGVPPPGLPPFAPPEPFGLHRPSILPNKAREDPMEQYMEIDKSETSKLEQLVQNIETKLSDPNQCAICHRILSCKSALQMHYRYISRHHAIKNVQKKCLFHRSSTCVNSCIISQKGTI